ncbi:MAG: hypothetical protein WCP28_08920 [Actinomycetes bacterium]
MKNRHWVLVAAVVVVALLAGTLAFVALRTNREDGAEPAPDASQAAPEPSGDAPEPMDSASASPAAGSTVSGKVTCTPAPQTVWVGSNRPGASGWATVVRVNEKTLSYSFNVPGGSWFRLDVGCGGTPKSVDFHAKGDWWLAGSSAYNADCSGPNGRCYIHYGP